MLAGEMEIRNGRTHSSDEVKGDFDVGTTATGSDE